jgi:hypothetical protein
MNSKISKIKEIKEIIQEHYEESRKRFELSV